MSEIRNIRFVYESEDIVKFCETPLRAIFDEVLVLVYNFLLKALFFVVILSVFSLLIVGKS